MSNIEIAIKYLAMRSDCNEQECPLYNNECDMSDLGDGEILSDYCRRKLTAFVAEDDTQIAQLKQQLADEQELTVAAYMSGAASQRDKIRELERMLAEADDAIVVYGFGTCEVCTGDGCNQCSAHLQRTKAKARIEARKGKGD